MLIQIITRVFVQNYIKYKVTSSIQLKLHITLATQKQQVPTNAFSELLCYAPLAKLLL